jgi:nitric oxide reductase subunit B
MTYRRLWICLIAVVCLSFAALGYYGVEIYRKAPPLPAQVVTTDGTVIFEGQEIKDGQNVWQSMGGQQVGTVWGHGAYVAPDWSADWLHRESMFLLDLWARRQHETAYEALDSVQQAALRARLQREVRTNTYDPATGVITISADRAQAIAAASAHYAGLFGADPAQAKLREAYAIPANTIKTPERLHKMNAFFFWASWSCSTDRPGSTVTYTNNWPSEPLIENKPGSGVILWSIASVILLLAGVGALAWWHAVQRHREEGPSLVPATNPLLAIKLTPSMRATLKYFWVVAALIVVQVGLGGITAHYGVEGLHFFGFPLSDYLPYSVARTWHTQLGIFWIATAWLATGLFMGPAVSGYEPKFQRAGVNFLFLCLLIIVAGSMAGQWFAVRQKMGYDATFWFGHQGYEYVDLGRFWQIFLYVGLFLWLALMVRSLWPAITKPSESRHLLVLFTLSCCAIALFYGAGLMWKRQTNLAIAEYWRWWVIHLWVEGFFEVFATVLIAFLFTRMGLLRIASATANTLFATTLFLAGGILGTMHHLYFSGTPTGVLAVGAVFSALEIVPLTLIGFEAYENLTHGRAAPWVKAYRWPILFFVAVAFWNLVGAGVFGFLINPPIALYYMQGLNLTPLHGHTALFGVYGMLGIGLMLFCLRTMAPHAKWNDRFLSLMFWSINGGLALMALLSLLPVGIAQTWASIEYGMWYARSAEFMQQPFMQNLRWLRALGDTVFAAGILGLGWFVVRYRPGRTPPSPAAGLPATRVDRKERELVGTP